MFHELSKQICFASLLKWTHFLKTLTRKNTKLYNLWMQFPVWQSTQVLFQAMVLVFLSIELSNTLISSHTLLQEIFVTPIIGVE